MILLLTLLGFNDIVAFSWRVGGVDKHEKASHTPAVGVGFGWGLQFLALCSGSAFQENKDPATRSLRGKPWTLHFAAFFWSKQVQWVARRTCLAASTAGDVTDRGSQLPGFEISCRISAEATGWILSQSYW